MTRQEVIDMIRLFIIQNNNREITADVLRPILEAILNQPNALIGLLSNLQTADTTSLVSAINEINNKIGSGVKVFTGSDNPNIVPPGNYNVGDFYLRTFDNLLYQYDGIIWTAKGQPYGSASLDSNGNILIDQIPDLYINKITVFGNPFQLLKHPNNSNQSEIEVNDIILNGFRNNTTLWEKAQCLSVANINLDASWNVISAIEELPIN